MQLSPSRGFCDGVRLRDAKYPSRVRTLWVSALRVGPLYDNHNPATTTLSERMALTRHTAEQKRERRATASQQQRDDDAARR